MHSKLAVLALLKTAGSVPMWTGSDGAAPQRSPPHTLRRSGGTNLVAGASDEAVDDRQVGGRKIFDRTQPMEQIAVLVVREPPVPRVVGQIENGQRSRDARREVR